VSEVLFYHLTDRPLERALPEILEKALQKGWHVLLRAGDRPRLEALDAMLWNFRDDAFLPHGLAGEPGEALQPVLLSLGAGAGERAMLMLAEGARIDPGECARFTRTCLMFDGRDPEATAAAREDWQAVKAAGLEAVYWAEAKGSWVRT
jgi:DNA polymerase-3 subunit chi